MIEITGLKKSYGKKQVIGGIDLRLNPGEQAAIIGRNGCGKTTLLKMLAGIIKPDHGHIRYFGHDIVKEKNTVRNYCGYLPQDDPLIPELNAQDNISIWSGYKGRPDERLISLLQLDELLKTPVCKLSGGMKRRVSLACAIVNFPPVLLMDEPTGSLDFYFKKEIRDFMSGYVKNNGILIVATHDKEEIDLSSRVFEMSDGMIAERRRTDEL